MNPRKGRVWPRTGSQAVRPSVWCGIPEKAKRLDIAPDALKASIDCRLNSRRGRITVRDPNKVPLTNPRRGRRGRLLVSESKSITTAHEFWLVLEQEWSVRGVRADTRADRRAAAKVVNLSGITHAPCDTARLIHYYRTLLCARFRLQQGSDAALGRHSAPRRRRLPCSAAVGRRRHHRGFVLIERAAG
jgi:hypothetical protein